MNMSTYVKIFCVLALSGLLWSSANAYYIVVEPREVVVQPGAGVAFEAMTFTEDKVPVEIREYRWQVVPEELGTIDEDGFFVASRNSGKGKIIASTEINGKRYAGTAHVQVGLPPEQEVVIKVRPEKAFVTPGGKQQFTVIAHSKKGVSLRVKNVRWMVEPRDLGTITRDGLFQAGRKLGHGVITALVEINNQIYKGEAGVVVSHPPTCSITGVVTNEGNLPLESATVRATLIGAPGHSRRVQTNELGEYVLDQLIPGVYLVRAVAPGYVPEYYKEAEYPMAGLPIKLSADETVNDINFTLSEGGTISGQVTLQDDDAPLADVHVVAHKVLAPKRPVHTITNDDGTYVLEGLTTGAYVVKAKAPGYDTEYYLEAEKVIDADFVSVDAPVETPDINFTLTTTAALKGLVTDEAGDPLAKAVVSVIHANRPYITDNKSFHHKVVTNENGEYAMSLRPGNYYVMATATGHVSEWYEDAPTPGEADLVEIVKDQHTVIDFQLAAQGTITGIVVDSLSSQPLAGAVVKAYAEGASTRNRHFRTLTKDDGTYGFDGLPRGKYVVVVSARGYLSEYWKEAKQVKDAEFVDVEDGVTVDDIDFTMVKAGSIAGIVLEKEANHPIADAIIHVHKIDGVFSKKGRSVEDGSYEIDGLPNGEYIVHAIARGYDHQFYFEVETREEAIPVEVIGPNQTPDINFALIATQETPTGIVGTVIDDETELPIDGAVVMAMPLTFAKPRRAVTGLDGNYELLGLRPGIYIALCFADNYVGEYFDNTRRLLKARPIRVAEDQVVENIDFGLEPREQGAYFIAGKVAQADGAPIEGALIYAVDGEVLLTQVTDESGEFQIPSVPAGNYTLTASVPSFSDQTVQVAVGDGKNSNSTELQLSRSTTTVETETPEEFSLLQNFPNPFNPTTAISFSLPTDADVRLTVYNILGVEVSTLIDKSMSAGVHKMQWDGKNAFGQSMPSGIYIYQLEARSSTSSFVDMKRMILIK